MRPPPTVVLDADPPTAVHKSSHRNLHVRGEKFPAGGVHRHTRPHGRHFDVDEVIYELANHATMIMVFLDPIGKALVSRCMNVVEKLATEHSAKMSYYLTKFDTAGDEVDRTNVVSQIVQELQGRVKATHALKLHTMYLPERASEEVKKRVPNKIDDLCKNIRLEIDSRVQDVLDNLTKDCQALTKIVDDKVSRSRMREGVS